MKIIEIARLDHHPVDRVVGHTLRMYFDSGLRVTVWKSHTQYIGLDPLQMSWNTSTENLHPDIEKLVEPVIEENRPWLLEQ